MLQNDGRNTWNMIPQVKKAALDDPGAHLQGEPLRMETHNKWKQEDVQL